MCSLTVECVLSDLREFVVGCDEPQSAQGPAGADSGRSRSSYEGVHVCICVYMCVYVCILADREVLMKVYIEIYVLHVIFIYVYMCVYV